MRSKAKILYIMGRGHNGSTALNLLLGGHRDVCALGEITSGLRRAENEPCACGKPMLECDLWGPVLRGLGERFPNVGLDGYIRMLRYMDNFYRIPQVLTRIGHFAGLDMSEVADRLERNEGIPIGHNVGGNYAVYSGGSRTFRFRPNVDWKTKLAKPYWHMYRLVGLVHAAARSLLVSARADSDGPQST